MKEIIDIRNWIRTNGDMSEDGKTITYNCKELEKVIADALEQVKNCNKADVSNMFAKYCEWCEETTQHRIIHACQKCSKHI